MDGISFFSLKSTGHVKKKDLTPLPALLLIAAVQGAPTVRGLDHVPIAVDDLDSAASRYQALGFALKPGRPHANGIQNRHVKFPDGTELELITAPEARDDLTATYRRHIAQGDGPAFLSLFAPDTAGLRARLHAAGIAARASGVLTSLSAEPGLNYIFFGLRNQAPTDRPEHFAHANTAESLIAVWLASDDPSKERAMLEPLGVRIATRDVHVPAPTRASVARFAEGELILLPPDRQLLRGRAIIGVTLRVRDIAIARRVIENAGLQPPPTVDAGNASSIFLPPSLTHGLWIELRAPRP